MTLPAVNNPYVPFVGLQGAGINGGKLYIGVDGQDPEVNPQACFWDAAGAVPAAQPISVVGGYPTRLGSPAQLFTAPTYSMRLRDRFGVQVFYVPSAIQARSEDSIALTNVAALRALTNTNRNGAPMAFVSGYSAAGDGGGGWFSLLAGSALPDNGGTVIRDASNNVWLRDAEGVLNVRWFGAKGDGATNDSAAIQSAINVQFTRGGGPVFFPPGTYVCNVTLNSGVLLVSQMGPQFGYLAQSISAVTLKQGAAGAVVDTPATPVFSCGVVGINFKGIGAGTPGVGVRLRNFSWGSVRGCNFDLFADQAVLKEGGNANTFEDILTTNVIMNRTRTSVTGAIHLTGGADDFLSRIEANTSQTAISSASLFVCGIVIQSTNAFITNCIGEISDYGIYVEGTGKHRIVNCRADLNYGPGLYIGGPSQVDNVLALGNSRNSPGVYPAFQVVSQSSIFSNCKAEGTEHSYGFVDNANFSAVWARNSYMGCTSFGHVNQTFSMQGFLGSSAIESPIALRGSGPVPNLDGTTFYIPTDSSAVMITDFLGKYSGKTIRIAGNSNVTIQNGSAILTNTGANKVLASGKIYRFTFYNNVWIEDA